MYSIKPGLLLGFHGCDKKVADAIVNHQDTFKESRNIYDWLGWGMYFWENNIDRAMEFAIEHTKGLLLAALKSKLLRY